MRIAEVGATIFYQRSSRPDEAGMSYVPDVARAAALKEQLVKRGFLVVKTVSAPAKAISGLGGSSAPALHMGADD
jgi:hypothetical protein